MLSTLGCAGGRASAAWQPRVPGRRDASLCYRCAWPRAHRAGAGGGKPTWASVLSAVMRDQSAARAGEVLARKRAAIKKGELPLLCAGPVVGHCLSCLSVGVLLSVPLEKPLKIGLNLPRKRKTLLGSGGRTSSPAHPTACLVSWVRAGSESLGCTVWPPGYGKQQTWKRGVSNGLRRSANNYFFRLFALALLREASARNSSTVSSISSSSRSTRLPA